GRGGVLAGEAADGGLHLGGFLAAEAVGEDGAVELLAGVLGGGVGREVGVEELGDGAVDDLLDLLEDEALDVAPLQDALALAVEALALVLHDLVVLED